MTLIAFALGATLVAAEPTPAPTTPVQTSPGPLETTVPPAAGVLTLDEAVKRALENQPSTRTAEARVDAVKARIEQYKAELRPQLGVGATANFGSGKDFAGPSPNFQVGAQASWLVLDFGRTSAAVRSARLAVDTANSDLETLRQTIIAQVELAYFEAVARRELVGVVQASVEAETRHVNDAERLVKVGVKPSFDLAQAKTQLSIAKTQYARTQGDAKIALTRLGLAMGGASLQGVELPTGWPGPEPGEDSSVDALMNEAITTRPDALAFNITRRTAESAIDIAKLGLNPALNLTARLGYGASDSQNTGDWDTGPAWSAGASFNWPLFDGGRTAAQIDEARADRRAVDSLYESFEIGVRADIETAVVQIASAKEQLEAAQASEAIAKEALRLAEARYHQGLSSGVELADAQTNVVSVGADVVTAQWTLATARAQLRASLGRGAVR